MVSDNLIVSICCLTYNHEPYIRQCLDGFMMQKTDFHFEILIHDDASTDRTADIIREYEAKHPNIVKPIYQTENQHSKGIGVTRAYQFPRAKGKYIAICEGDDYWTDPCKLQKQVDFLETHSDFEVCTHDTLIKNERYKQLDGMLFSKFCDNIFLKIPQKVYTIEDTLTGNIFHISSIVFRNVSLQYPKWMNRFSAGDMVLFMLLAQQGKIYFVNDVMSVYRSNVKSITNTRPEYASQIAFIKMSIDITRLMNKHFNRQYQKEIHSIIARYYMRLAFLYLRKSNKSLLDARQMAKMARKYDAKTYIKYLFIEFFQVIKRRL